MAKTAGLGIITPHQLRHTYATALVNAGVSLQVLMQLLGHSTAEMSLRYGRLFYATVRADYERALVLAKERLGPVLPSTPTVETIGNWQELPVIKARLAGRYCLRTPAQGASPYANICEHCPNFRSERTRRLRRSAIPDPQAPRRAVRGAGAQPRGLDRALTAGVQDIALFVAAISGKFVRRSGRRHPGISGAAIRGSSRGVRTEGIRKKSGGGSV